MNKPPDQQQAYKSKPTPASAWWLLSLAICFEIAGAIGLNFGEGFSLLLPTILALAAFAVALYLVSHVMKNLPVSVAYPIWAGGGTAGVALLGVIIFDESMDIFKALGIALVIIGVITINRNSD